MKSLILLLLCLLLLLPNVIYSQKILKIVKGYVLIDLDESSGFKKGDELPVLRVLDSGETKEMGRIKIIVFKGNICAGKIVSENSPYKIRVGDFISTSKNSYSHRQKNFISYLSMGLGVAAGGLSYYFHHQANQTFKEYESADIAEDAVRLYDKTVSYDKKSQISLGIGGGLVAFGLISRLLFSSDRPAYHTNSLSISPVYADGYIGVTMKFCLNK